MGGNIPRHLLGANAAQASGSGPFTQALTRATLAQVGLSGQSDWDGPSLAVPAELPAPHYQHKVNIKGPGWDELRQLCGVLDLGDRAYVAGGACRRAHQGVSLADGDIDIYSLVGSLDATRKQLQKIAVPGREEVHTTPSGKVWGRDFEIMANGELYRVQLVEFLQPISPDELLHTFDLSCVSAAFNAKTHEVTMDTAFESDNLTRTLRFRKIRSVNAFLRRMEKYGGLGYTMEDDHRRLVAKALSHAPEGGDSEYGEED